MRTLTFKCAITCPKRPALNLQDAPVSLKGKSGTTTWSGTKSVEFDDALKIDAAVVGVEDSPWSIDITVGCPKGQQSVKIFHDEGTIPHGGGEGIGKSVQVPPDPCKPQQGKAADSKENMAVASAKETSGGKTAIGKARKKSTIKKKRAKKVPRKQTTT